MLINLTMYRVPPNVVNLFYNVFISSLAIGKRVQNPRVFTQENPISAILLDQTEF